jgi:hypothetical protein
LDPLVSARIQHALSETNSGFGLAPYAIGAQGAHALQSAGEGGQEVRGCPRQATPQQVHSCADLRLSRRPRYPTARARRGRAAQWPDTRRDARTPGLAAVAPTRRRYGPDRPYPADIGMLVPGLTAYEGGTGAAVHALLAEGFGSMSMRSTSMPSPVSTRTAAASSCSVSQRFLAAGVSESRTARNIARLTSCPRM